MKLEISSKAFTNGNAIPARYTCDGEDVSPPVAWSNIPAACKSLVLICDDPDAPGQMWSHFVCYDIPPSVQGIAEGCPKSDTLPGGGKQGKSDFGAIGYGGPCPPSGTHRYFFKLYALDTMLNLPAGKTKAQIEHAIKRHIIEEAFLFGTYARKR
ncbi:MAG: YbhB/YbcL family Raf kinase inhibitor-like protein [Chitinivibrionales bacterium]|nr:YbhB/YbcL family Raf kinase inhibitor-like protein [Chitinivibrionales bacterium]